MGCISFDEEDVTYYRRGIHEKCSFEQGWRMLKKIRVQRAVRLHGLPDPIEKKNHGSLSQL
jgi:hypothetical protein